MLRKVPVVLSAVLGLVFLPAMAAPVDDLIRVDTQYTVDFFSSLGLKRETRIKIKDLNDQQLTLAPMLKKAKGEYTAQNLIYLGKLSELNKIRAQIEASQKQIDKATTQRASAVDGAVKRGDFTDNSQVTDTGISDRQNSQETAAANLGTQMDSVRKQIRREQAKPEYKVKAKELNDSKVVVAHLQKTIGEGRSRRGEIQTQLELDQSAIDRLLADLSAFERLRSDLEINIVPQLVQRSQKLTNRIRDVDQNLTILNADIEARRPRIDKMIADLRDTEDRLDKKNRRLDQFNNEIRDIDATLARLPEWRAQLNDLNSVKIPQAQRELSDATDRARDAQARVDRDRAAFDAVKAEAQAGNQELEKLNGDRERAQQKVGQLNAELASIAAALSNAANLEARRDQLKGVLIRGAQAKVESLTADLSQAQTELAKAREALQNEQAKLAGLMERQRNLQAELRTIESQQNALNEKLRELKRELDQVGKREENLQRLQEMKTNLEAKQEDAARTLEAAQADWDRLKGAGDGERQAARQRLKRAQAQVQDAQQMVQQIASQLADVNSKIAGISGGRSKDEIEAEIRDIESNQLPALQSQQQAKAAALADVKGQVDGNRDVANAKQAVAAADAKLNDIKGALNQSAAQLSKLNGELSEIESKLGNLDQLKAREQAIRTRELPSAQTTLADIDSAIAVARGAADAVAKRVQAAQAILRDSVALKQDADKNVGAATANLNRFQTLAANIQTQLSNATQLQRRRDELVAAVDQTRRDIADLERGQRELRRFFESEKRVFDDLVARFDQSSGERKDLFEKWTAVDHELVAQQDRLASTKAAIQQKQAELSGLQDDRNSLNAELDRLVQDIAQAQSELQPAQKRFAAARIDFDAYYAVNVGPFDVQLDGFQKQIDVIDDDLRFLSALATTLKNSDASIKQGSDAIAAVQPKADVLDAETKRLFPVVQALWVTLNGFEMQIADLEKSKAAANELLNVQLISVRSGEAAIDKIINDNMGGR